AFCFLITFFFISPSQAGDVSDSKMQDLLTDMEERFAAYGWNDINLREIPWEYHRVTKQGRPLFFAQFGSGSNCTMFLSAVHGDELPTAYLLLRLAHVVKNNPDQFRDKCIVIAPLLNPDGFFADPPTRVNGSGIDINRNFPTKDWNANALSLWEKNTESNKRYYPGSKAGSEQETLFQIALINRFKPQKILTMHSPLGFYDYDGASTGLDTFEEWVDKISKETEFPLKKFGTFPGSLGNYAGLERNILTLTLELPTSDPSKAKEYYDKFYPAFLKFIELSGK
ncbi:MAG: succinylglutamate desuccinylase/aspartoacylase family protein, partial [Deltaproteobacteria bacterium]|nr:succinylglutamate desuccinylase/aspartoacylase family protein [Deltaproteobacteria bacterium]